MLVTLNRFILTFLFVLGKNQVFDPVVFENAGDDFNDNDDEHDQEDVEEEEVKHAKRKRTIRHRWDEIEVQELKQYLCSYLDAKVTPQTKQVERAKKQSHARGGKIWKRSNDKIIKKSRT